MNILVIVFHFPPISGGGVIVAVEIANNLAKLGHKITVITPELEWDGPRYDPKIESNVNVIKVKVPSSNKIKIAARRCKSILKRKGEELGKQSKFDFIFTIFHPFQMASHAAVECGKKLEIPVIVKVDDAIYGPASSLKKLQRRIEKHYNSKALKKASFVLVSNESTKEIVSNFYNVKKNNIHIIPNGVELSKFEKSNLNANKIIFLGAMYYHRGLDILIESLPIVLENIPHVQIELYGEGPELSKLQLMVKEKKLEKNVSFMEWISNDKIPEILSKASIGIGPLRNTDVTRDALPIKVLEYMATSLPIIAAKGTLPNDILIDKKNGFLINDHTDLASKIVDILSDEDKRVSMGNKSREIVLKYDWKIISQKIEKLL